MTSHKQATKFPRNFFKLLRYQNWISTFIIIFTLIFIPSSLSLKCSFREIDNCSKCSTANGSEDTCEKCLPHHFLFYYNMLCLPCDHLLYGMVGCGGDCSGETFQTKGTIECNPNECKDGYFEQVQSYCVPCKEMDRGCKKCIAEINEVPAQRKFKCTECEGNQGEFYINELGYCYKCNMITPNCLKCTYHSESDKKCDECEFQYELNSNTGECNYCAPSYRIYHRYNYYTTIYQVFNSKSKTCHKCDTFGCIECYYNQEKEKEMCLSCPSYYQGIDNEGRCIYCSSFDPNCNYCQYSYEKEKMVCTSCSSGYGINAEGKCVSCSNEVLPNCYSCGLNSSGKMECYDCISRYGFDKDGSCISCADYFTGHCRSCGFNKQLQKLICDSCDSRYGFDKDGNCISCADYFTGYCRSCGFNKELQKLICDSCDSKYGLNKNGICVHCDEPNCRHCGYNEVIDKVGCTECDSEYAVNTEGHCIHCSIAVNTGCERCQYNPLSSKIECTYCPSYYAFNHHYYYRDPYGYRGYFLTNDKICTTCKDTTYDGTEGCYACNIDNGNGIEKSRIRCGYCENNDWAHVTNIYKCLPNDGLNPEYISLKGCLKASYKSNDYFCYNCKGDYILVWNDGICLPNGQVNLANCIEFENLGSKSSPIYSCSSCNSLTAKVIDTTGFSECMERTGNLANCYIGKKDITGKITCSVCEGSFLLETGDGEIPTCIPKCLSGFFRRGDKCIRCTDYEYGNPGCDDTATCEVDNMHGYFSCSKCRDGYVEFTEGQCFKCTTKIENCRKCHMKTEVDLVCDECEYGNVKDNKCPTSCATNPNLSGCLICDPSKITQYTKKNICEKCDDYYFMTKDQKCVYCKSSKNGGDGCQECEYKIENDVETDKIQCKTCMGGYIKLKNGKCIKPDCQAEFGNGCASCNISSDSITCSYCKDGFYLKDGNCISIKSLAPQIANCASQTYKAGSYVNGVPKVTTECTECDTNYSFNESGECIKNEIKDDSSYIDISGEDQIDETLKDCYEIDVYSNGTKYCKIHCDPYKYATILNQENKCVTNSARIKNPFNLQNCIEAVYNETDSSYSCISCNNGSRLFQPPPIINDSDTDNCDIDNTTWNDTDWNKTDWNNKDWNKTDWNNTGWNKTDWNKTDSDDTGWNKTDSEDTDSDDTDWNKTGSDDTDWNKTDWNNKTDDPSSYNDSSKYFNNNCTKKETTIIYIDNSTNYNYCSYSSVYDIYPEKEAFHCGNINNLGTDEDPLYTCVYEPYFYERTRSIFVKTESGQIYVNASSLGELYCENAKASTYYMEDVITCDYSNYETPSYNSYNNTNRNKTSDGVCSFGFVSIFSIFYDRQICQNIYSPMETHIEVNYDKFKDVESIEADNGECPSYFFTYNEKQCYQCRNKIVGMEGCKGQCTFNERRQTVLKCEKDKCKEGFLEEREGICKKCEDIMPGCLSCNYTSSYDKPIRGIKRIRKFQCNQCEDNYYLDAESKNCQKCSYYFDNCQKCGIIDFDFKCYGCIKGAYLNDNNECEICPEGKVITNSEQCVSCSDISMGGTRNCQSCSNNGTAIICDKCEEGYLYIAENQTCVDASLNLDILKIKNCMKVSQNEKTKQYQCDKCEDDYVLLSEPSIEDESYNETKCVSPSFLLFYNPLFYIGKKYENLCSEAVNLATEDNPKYTCSKCHEVSNVNNTQDSTSPVALTLVTYENDTSLCLNPSPFSELLNCTAAKGIANETMPSGYSYHCKECVPESKLVYFKDNDLYLCQYKGEVSSCMIKYCRQCKRGENYFCEICASSQYVVSASGGCIKASNKVPAVTWKDMFRLEMNGVKNINGMNYYGPSVNLRGITTSEINTRHAFIIYLIFEITVNTRNRNLQGEDTLNEKVKVKTICEILENLDETADNVNSVDYECIGDQESGTNLNGYKLSNVENEDSPDVILSSNFNEMIQGLDLENNANDLENKKLSTFTLDNLDKYVIFNIEKKDEEISELDEKGQLKFNYKGKFNKEVVLTRNINAKLKISRVNDLSAECIISGLENNLTGALNCTLEGYKFKDKNISSFNFITHEINDDQYNIYLSGINDIQVSRKTLEQIEMPSNNDNNEEDENDSKNIIIIVVSCIAGACIIGGSIFGIKYCKNKKEKTNDVSTVSVQENKQDEENNKNGIQKIDIGDGVSIKAKIDSNSNFMGEKLALNNNINNMVEDK